MTTALRALHATETIEHAADLIADIEAEATAVYEHDLTHDDESCFDVRRTFQDRWSRRVQPIRQRSRAPHSPLRVGYFSCEWSGHSIFGPVILGHTAAVQPYTYSMLAPNWAPDAATHRYRTETNWRDVGEHNIRDVARIMYDDDLDILVDLMGFSFGLPHLVYAQRPARAIVTAWGHVTAGTQHPQIAYLFADPVALPAHERSLYSERVLDLPCMLAYQPPAGVPAIRSVGDRPFRYGCFHRFAKVTDQTLRAWAEILWRVPRAELVLKAWDFEPARDLARLRDVFGPAARRVRIDSATHWAEHLNDMHDIDVQLDTLPFTGGVVTMEALLMGVPTVTRPGRLPGARCGATIMRTVGLDGWVVANDADYIERAVQAYVERGDEPRTRYRERLLDSPIGRIPDYIAAVEQRYQEIAGA